MSRASLKADRLSIDEVVARVEHAGAGAVALFVGTVRDTNEGRSVSRLEYEAYAPMALAEMERIADEIEKELTGVRCAVAHRVGSLAVGEAAVVCAASAPHRPAAFAACRKLIDRIKERVPIWKREHGPDGPYWVGWEDARCSHHETTGGSSHGGAAGAHEAGDATSGLEARDGTSSFEARDAIPAHQARDFTPAHEAQDATAAHEPEDATSARKTAGYEANASDPEKEHGRTT